MGITRSQNEIGNPYHDESTGKFASADGGGSARQGERGSASYIPRTTSAGKPRRFFKDYSADEKKAIADGYRERHGKESAMIAKLGSEFPTIKDRSESRERLRAGMVSDEIKSQDPSKKLRQRKATIILGLPGSGKSRIANRIFDEQGAFIIDADNFKRRIPEFREDHMMLSAVHGESVELSNRMRNELAEDGYNMVIGKVGGDIESVEYVVNELASKGYEVDVALNDVPLEVAMDRTIGRYDRGETNRLVPLHTLLNADGNIFGVFDYLMRHPAVKSGRIYNNDVPKEQGMPTLIKEYRK